MEKYIKIKCLIVYLFLAAVLLTSCGNEKTAEENVTAQQATIPEDENSVELTQSQLRAIGLTLGSPEKRPLSGILKVNGFIDVPPQNLVSITTQMGGIVKSTPLLQGSMVKKGQVIAVLQNQEYVAMQQDYLESKSQLELTDAEYKRQQTLARQNVNSQKVLQQAKANYQSTLTQVNALEERLRLININPETLTAQNIRSQINIYSPISGYVTKVNVNTGKFVNPNDVMFEIVNGSNLHVELNVFEKDAVKVRSGQKILFTLNNDTTQRTAIVQLVGKEINPDKTVTVHSVANGGSAHFIPGTYVKALIETGSNKVLALPEEAVLDFEGNKYIFISTESKNEAVSTKNNGNKQGEQTYHFKMTPVTTGISDAGYIEVQLPENLDASGKVVTKGAYDLLSKLKNSEEE
ncbi:MAG: efflux transporter periplasmic adaptor subunit [Bacteroidetes bacterium 46-16]|nr:MAG: efflux transporter periplasmic adaptor subunit [Bacteroidetes bacterium 46-16]